MSVLSESYGLCENNIYKVLKNGEIIYYFKFIDNFRVFAEFDKIPYQKLTANCTSVSLDEQQVCSKPRQCIIKDLHYTFEDVSEEEYCWINCCLNINNYICLNYYKTKLQKITTAPLIIGNWYKLKMFTIHNYFVKYNTDWKNCEYIICNTRNIYSTNGTFSNISDIVLIEDLSIIQDFLPDNHLDKIKNFVQSNNKFKFIPGKWYYYLNNDFIIKCLSFENNKFISNCAINIINKSKPLYQPDSHNIMNLTDIGEEADINLYKYCLPINHLDNDYKFKVGDKVKIIKDGGGFGTEDLGKIVTITNLGMYSITSNGYKVDPKLGNTKENSFGGFNRESSFELITENSIVNNEIKLSIFPIEGITDINTEFVDFIKQKYPNCAHQRYDSHKYIAWNSSSYYYVIDVNKSSRTYYTNKQLNHFVTFKYNVLKPLVEPQIFVPTIPLLANDLISVESISSPKCTLIYSAYLYKDQHIDKENSIESIRSTFVIPKYIPLEYAPEIETYI